MAWVVLEAFFFVEGCMGALVDKRDGAWLWGWRLVLGLGVWAMSVFAG